jgi:hypothetical protein
MTFFCKDSMIFFLTTTLWRERVLWYLPYFTKTMQS